MVKCLCCMSFVCIGKDLMEERIKKIEDEKNYFVYFGWLLIEDIYIFFLFLIRLIYK